MKLAVAVISVDLGVFLFLFKKKINLINLNIYSWILQPESWLSIVMGFIQLLEAWDKQKHNSLETEVLT